MSKIEEITKELTLRAQQAIPNPSTGRVSALPEKNLQRRLDRFYLDAAEIRSREDIGIISWARILLGFREQMVEAGYPGSVVSPLVRSILFQSARPQAAPEGGKEAVPVDATESAGAAKDLKDDALVKKALDLQAKGKRQQAMATCNTILARNPSHFVALNVLGTLKAESGDDEAAVDAFQKAIAIEPDVALTHNNLGSTFSRLGEGQRARDCYDRAIGLDPKLAIAYRNRGAYFTSMDDFEAALVDFDEAIRLEPDKAELHLRRASALGVLLRIDEALAELDRALSLQPGMIDAVWDKALLMLVAGRFAEGWELYESRRDFMKWSLSPSVRAPEQWTGLQDVRGKTVVIVSEQGFGDVIQFSRYVPLVRERAGRAILTVDATLAPLLRRMDPGIEIVNFGEQTPVADYWCGIASLPRIFGTTDQNAPTPHAYLKAEESRIAKWSAKLGPKRKLRVGVVWSGNPRHVRDMQRSIKFETLDHYLPEGFDYVSLQRDVRPIDKDALASSSRIRHFGVELADFDDTAALCKLMDVVVTVDTSAAHLSAALGCPTWILIPRSPDWRWLLDREDSHWYRSARLLRQGSDYKWEPVLKRVANELEKLRSEQEALA